MIELIASHNLDFFDGNIVKYAVRNKQGENLKEKYDKDIACELAKELKCGFEFIKFRCKDWS